MNSKYIALIIYLLTILQSHSQTTKLSKKESKYYSTVNDTYEVLSESDRNDFKVFANTYLDVEEVFQLYCKILKNERDVNALQSLTPTDENLVKIKDLYLVETYISLRKFEEANKVFDKYPESEWPLRIRGLLSSLDTTIAYKEIPVKEVVKVDYENDVIDVEKVNSELNLLTLKIAEKYFISSDNDSSYVLKSNDVNYAYPTVIGDLVVFVGETKNDFDLYHTSLALFNSTEPVSYNLGKDFTYITTPVFRSYKSLCFIGLEESRKDESIYCGFYQNDSISLIKEYETRVGSPVFLKAYNGNLIVGAKKNEVDDVDVYVIDDKNNISKFDQKINSSDSELNCFYTSSGELLFKNSTGWHKAILQEKIDLEFKSQIVHIASKGKLIVECHNSITDKVISRDEFDSDVFNYSYSLENEAVIYFKKKGYMFQTYNIGKGKKLPEKINIELRPIEKNETLVIDNVFFDNNSFELKSSSIPALSQLAVFLKENHAKVEIGGHTDNLGDKEYNTKLSLNRANSIKNKLIELGVVAGQITCVGYGSSMPYKKNDTKEGRAKNRRVELKIL